MHMWSSWRAACLACVSVFVGRGAPASPAMPPPQSVELISDMPAAGDLAAPANGQTLYVLDEARGEVVAVDPFEPAKRWQAVAAGPPGPETELARSIACIDTSMIALLCRTGESWSLRTHRLQPGLAADPGKPAQTVAVGSAQRNAGKETPARAMQTVADERVCLVVSPSRDWLGVCGLPVPLASVLRAPIAGARVGSLSARGCPVVPAVERLTAATISTAEEFVLFTRNQAGQGAAARAGDPPSHQGGRPTVGTCVSFHLPPDPRSLLRLDTSLPQVRDAAFCRTDGTLWVAGGEAGSEATPEGLWRIDGVLRQRRQAVQAVCVAKLDGARSVVCLSEKAIIVTHGREARKVSRIDPTRPASSR